MFKINKIILTIFLFSFSIEASEFLYEKANNFLCENITSGCIFSISPSYPFSPKIPTEIPVHAILSNYRYIYLIFHIPKNQKKQFHLMAYDTSNQETIISNGDYYDIDCNINTEYELRIFNELKEKSYVQFLFLGLQKNFQMKVEIKFKLNLTLYYNDFKLSKDNSLILANNNIVLNYFKDISNKLREKLEIIPRVKNICQKLFKIFDITIKYSPEILTDSKTIFTPPCFIVKISHSIGLESSVGRFFEPDDDILSYTQIEKGKIKYHIDGEDLLKDIGKLDSTVLKYFTSYDDIIENTFLELGVDAEPLSITVSTNPFLDSVTFSLAFYKSSDYLDLEFELELEIEVINPLLPEVEPIYAFNIDWNALKNPILVKGIVFALGIITTFVGAVNGINDLNLLPLNN